MHNQPHPDLEMLDRLRAGLLDDRPDERSALEQHLAGCETCRLHLDGWQQLGPSALGPRLDTASLAGELQAARRRALNSPRQHRHRVFAPYATAAILLIAVSIGFWTMNPVSDTPQMTAGSSQAVPDIYEDLDFYLWLANQKDNGNGDENGNPNNT